jgi:hypothetical protein
MLKQTILTTPHSNYAETGFIDHTMLKLTLLTTPLPTHVQTDQTIVASELCTILPIQHQSCHNWYPNSSVIVKLKQAKTIFLFLIQ